jgi:4-amino-4-deoxy-L-arabinose transferase-like glycosyltransferase
MKPGRAALLFLLALATRVPMLITQHDDYASGGITTTLGLVARNLLEGRGLVETIGPDAILRLYDRQQAEARLIDIREFPDPSDQPTKPLIQRMPGYPVFLALVWRVVGDYRYLPAQGTQVVLGILLPLLLYAAGALLFGERAGVLAGAFAALAPPLAWLSVVPLYDGWILLLAGLVVWILARNEVRGHPLGGWAWLGLVAAAGVYFKSTFLIVPLFAAAALVPSVGLKRAALRGALALGLPVLALTPWVARNERIFHRPILTNTFFWATVWEGLGETENHLGAVLDDRVTYASVLAEHPGISYASPEYDDLLRARVLDAARSDPLFFVRLALRRLVRALLLPNDRWGISAAEDPRHSYAAFRARGGGAPAAYLSSEPLAALVKIAQWLWNPALLCLAALGLWTRRTRWRELLPILGVAMAFLAPAVLLHLEGRYLLPASLVWGLLAAGSVRDTPSPAQFQP